ncbi:MAG: CBS domain-containing protein [bacterium]
MKVADVMRHNPVVANRENSIQEAAEIMRVQQVEHLIVVDTETGEIPVGIVTGSDLVIEIMAERVGTESVTVGDIMATDLYTALEVQDIGEALMLMREKQVHHLPVVDKEGQLTGVLFVYDLMDRMIDENARQN